VNHEFVVFDPPGEVTTTLLTPGVPAGIIQVMRVALSTKTLVADVPPIVTPVAPARFVPVIVTLVPPAIRPLVGETAVTTGAAM
jgi:hypothetical protein